MVYCQATRRIKRGRTSLETHPGKKQSSTYAVNQSGVWKEIRNLRRLMNEIDLLDTQSRTCKACGLICNDYDKLGKHVGSERCRRRMCEKQGKIFTPDAELPKYCKHCKMTMQRKSWSRHIKSVKHINNVANENRLPIYCPICNK